MRIALFALLFDSLIARRLATPARLCAFALLLFCAPQAGAQVAVTGVERVELGAAHSCLLSTTGGVRCWGSNQQGQLGNGGGGDSRYPVAVQGLGSGVLSLDVSDNHACAVTAAGGVKCWGQNDSGQLGDGSTQSRATPVDVVGLTSGAVAVATGISSSCALLGSGQVRCWGANFAGQLGNGSTSASNTPVAVTGLPGPMQQLVSGENFACARTSAGSTYCWGSNYQGQLALGGSLNEITTATLSTALDSSFAGLTAGGLHACGLQSGAARCWGDNFRGQLGNETLSNRSTPWPVSGLGSGVASLGLGSQHSCAAFADGSARCWGNNTAGQLGDGSTSLRTFPVTVADLGEVRLVAGGSNHSCAVLNSGGLRCWGANGSGQLGDGTTTGRTTPVTVQQRSVPDAPTAVVAAAGDASASVSFTAPARDGGSPILGYLVTAQPGNVQGGLCAASPCSVNGLQNGIGYSFSVVARNALGDSPASTPSASVTPRRSQTLSFGANPGPLAWGTSGAAVSAAASSGLGVVYSSLTPAVCGVDAVSGVLSLLQVGSCEIAADQAGDAATLPAARAIQTVQILRATQNGFSVGADAPLVLLGGSLAIRAQGGQSSAAISLSLAAGSPCTLTGSTLSGVDVGTCTVVATRPGDAFYEAASASVAVNVFARGLSGLEVVGQSLSPAFNPAVGLYILSVANGVQQIPVRATARDPLAAVLLNNQIATPGSTIAVNLNTGANLLPVTVIAQDGSQQTYQLVVNRRFAQSIQLTLPATAVLGDAPLTLLATGGASGQPVQISSQTPAVCSLNGSELQLLSAGRCELRANQAGDANHDPAPELLRTLDVQPGVDLQISVDNGVASLAPQGAVVYRIELGNAGPSPAPATRLSATAPAGLADIEWVCTPVQGASCPAATGTGLPTLSVDLPVGGVLRFDVGARLNATPGTTVQLSASLQPPAGTVERAPADNTAVDTDTVLPFGVFSNGFEPTSTGLRMQQR